MAFSNGYIFGFAAGVCVVCSLALGTVSQALGPQQETNRRRDSQKNVLEAVGLVVDGKTESGERLTGPLNDELYNTRVEALVIDASTGKVLDGKTQDDVLAARAAIKGTDKTPELLAVFQRVDDGKVVKTALQMDGVGLWGAIGGFLALDTDGRTISGATFAAPKETPGLGYEITQTPFRSQWPGKKIYNDAGPRPIVVNKAGSSAQLCPGAASSFCVDGISGATMTGDGVTNMVASTVSIYEPYLKNLRAGGAQ